MRPWSLLTNLNFSARGGQTRRYFNLSSPSSSQRQLVALRNCERTTLKRSFSVSWIFFVWGIFQKISQVCSWEV